MKERTDFSRSDRPRRRLSRRGLPWLLIGLTLSALLTGCEINEPAMPTFDTTLTIPLGVERVDIMEAIENEDYLEVLEDGSLSFSIDGDPDTMSFDFDLSADIGSQTIEQGLGNFSIAAADPMDYEFQLGDIWAPAAGASGLPAIVPSFPIDVVSGPQDVPDIDSAVLADGQVVITLDNHLPVSVGADAGPAQLVIRLENPADGQAFATLAYPEILPGQSSTQTAELAGVNLPGSIQVSLAGESAGSSGAVVTVNSDDSLQIEAAFQDLVVSSATAVVGPQSFNTSFETELPADYTIERAAISGGSVTLQLTNDMPVPCQAQLAWEHLRNDQDQPLSRSFALAAGQSLSRMIDFAGYSLESDGEALEALTAQVDITSPGSDGQSVTLSADAGLTAVLQGGTISFSSVTGVVPATTVSIDPIVEEIDLPEEMDGIALQAATMTLRVANSSGLPADLDLTLSGTSASGTTVSMEVNEHILAADDRATTTDIVLNQNNSEIVDFLNNLPVNINLGGDVVVGGGGVVGTVRQDDYAVVSWDIVAPVEVIINGASLDTDPEALDLDADMREMIEDRARAASIRTEILNHLPVGVQITIKAHTDTSSLATAPLLAIGPLDVEPALVDPFTHLVSVPVTSYPTIDLTAEEARVFALEGLHTMIEAYLPESDGPVRMLSTDYLEVHGVIQMDVRVADQW